jgi:hypothetical protein
MTETTTSISKYGIPTLTGIDNYYEWKSATQDAILAMGALEVITLDKKEKPKALASEGPCYGPTQLGLHTTYHLQRTAYNVPITTYSLQRTGYIVPSTMYSSPPPAYQHHYLATLYPAQWVTHIVPDTMYSAQCAVPSLPTLQSTTDTTQCERTM